MKQYLPKEKEEEKEVVDEFGSSSFARLRKFIWELFEEPNKSKLGKVVITTTTIRSLHCTFYDIKYSIKPNVTGLKYIYVHYYHFAL